MTNISINKVRVLGQILTAADKHFVVAWDAGSGLLRGPVRAITTEGGGFLHGKDNIWGGHLWVTANGWEHFLPIPKVVDMIDAGELHGIEVGL